MAAAARRDSLEVRRHSRAEAGALSRSGGAPCVWIFSNASLVRRGSTAMTEQTIPENENVEILTLPAKIPATRRKSAADLLENRLM